MNKHSRHRWTFEYTKQHIILNIYTKQSIYYIKYAPKQLSYCQIQNDTPKYENIPSEPIIYW